MFLSFCEKEGDCGSVSEILKDESVKQNSCHLIYNGNVNEALSVIRNADCVIATRFHAMVLGFAMNKKTLPIVYNLKMSNVLDDLQFENAFISSSVINISTEESEKWYNEYNFYDFDNVARESTKQFKALDEALLKSEY